MYAVKTSIMDCVRFNGFSFIISNVSCIRLDFMLHCPYRLRDSLFAVLSVAEKTYPPRLRYIVISHIPFPLLGDLVGALDFSTLKFYAYVTLLVDEETLNSAISGAKDVYTPVQNIADVKLVTESNIPLWITLLTRGIPGCKAVIREDF
ncbi:hypothetical protein TRICI_005545 [Trichomonascus ciferrii]|uniref:Uncharacterized protein n=1 Tax=Trichomonascus ciferrii TaxID=44093 RepID=A0A642US79_9ASCO|nr:hypothetical protein TRICI_005545 [Trichomonascus ciferrii]